MLSFCIFPKPLLLSCRLWIPFVSSFLPLFLVVVVLVFMLVSASLPRSAVPWRLLRVLVFPLFRLHQLQEVWRGSLPPPAGDVLRRQHPAHHLGHQGLHATQIWHQSKPLSDWSLDSACYEWCERALWPAGNHLCGLRLLHLLHAVRLVPDGPRDEEKRDFSRNDQRQNHMTSTPQQPGNEKQKTFNEGTLASEAEFDHDCVIKMQQNQENLFSDELIS